MSYRYLEDIAFADEAFEATGDTLEELFAAAAEATMNVMVGDIATIRPQITKAIALQDTRIDMLLFQYVQEFIFFKDAEQLLLRNGDLKIESKENDADCRLTAELSGERLDPARHDLRVDVKAVTMHRFSVGESKGRWRAVVVLDV